MKSTFKNILKKGFIGLVIVTGFAFTESAKNTIYGADFSGTWLLSLPKSDFGNSPLYTAPKKLKIVQDKDNIRIERLVIAASGADSTMNEKVPFNGKPFEMLTADKRTRHYTITRTDNGQTLKEEYSSSYSGRPGEEEYHTIQTWKLSPDGKELFLTIQVNVANGYSYGVKAVYDKR